MRGMLLGGAREVRTLVEPMKTEKIEWKPSPMSQNVMPMHLFHEAHWGEKPLIYFHRAGRRPKGISEWAKCIWNYDIFIGWLPMLKSIILLELIGWLK